MAMSMNRNEPEGSTRSQPSSPPHTPIILPTFSSKNRRHGIEGFSRAISTQNTHIGATTSNSNGPSFSFFQFQALDGKFSPRSSSPASSCSSSSSSSKLDVDSPRPRSRSSSQQAHLGSTKACNRARIITEGNFTVEEAEDGDYDGFDSDAESAIRPHEYEDGDSERARSRSPKRFPTDQELDPQILIGLQSLNCDEGDASNEKEIWLQERREERRRKRRSSGSVQKRSLAQSIGSDTDDEDVEFLFEGANEAGSSARRLRRKVAGERASLAFDNPPPRIEELDELESHEKVVSLGEEDGEQQGFERELPYYVYDMEVDSDSDDEALQQGFSDLVKPLDYQIQDSSLGLLSNPPTQHFRTISTSRAVNRSHTDIDFEAENKNVFKCGTESTSAGSSYTNSKAVSSNSTTRKRRKVDTEEQEDDDVDGASDHQPPNGSKTSERVLNKDVRFACPFRKFDPRKYNIYLHRGVCAISHWGTISRVKEHLYRCHRMLPHCVRCWKTFKNDQELAAHYIADDRCERQPKSLPDGLTAEQERKLRSRKKSNPEQSPAERWEEMYKILFPGKKVPSPYFEGVQEETSTPQDARDLVHYEEYRRRELPRLIRADVEHLLRREMRQVSVDLVNNLIGIFQNQQDRIFISYLESIGPGPEGRNSEGMLMNVATNPSQHILQTEETSTSTSQDPSDSDPLVNILPHPLVQHYSSGEIGVEESAPGLLQSHGSLRTNHISDSGYSSSEKLCSCAYSCECHTMRAQDPTFDNEYNLENMGVGNGVINWQDFSTTFSLDALFDRQ